MDKINELIKELADEGPTVPLWPTAGNLLGISKSHTYALARADKFPAKVIKIGASYRVVTASLVNLISADTGGAA
ncbi:hypothetical protein [Gordonia alkaliphila]|uniref:DNA-binding protein n=1 Tax=Gordonia alkaliphila TaxID=1053547 RepID=A0ABP8ZGE1_9ACTN